MPPQENFEDLTFLGQFWGHTMITQFYKLTVPLIFLQPKIENQ